MRNFHMCIFAAVTCVVMSCSQTNKQTTDQSPELTEEKGYYNPAERYQLEFEKTKDPALGYVPYERLTAALNYTQELKINNAGKIDGLLWVERGPIQDFPGPSNLEQARSSTAGRVRAIFVDTLNDPSGNTVFCGGVAGGIWRCTNFISGAVPNWQSLSDNFNNLAVSSICQDPSNPSVMYFSTGEPTANADAVFGRGVWKSTNGGSTWTHLSATVNFRKCFKILCDAVGNVFLALHPTPSPVIQGFSLVRSSNGGATWTDITPPGLNFAPCTDLELSSTGKLHAGFGYYGNGVYHKYATDPANVTSGTWTTGFTRTVAVPKRIELACVQDTLYAATTNSAQVSDSVYKSVDGGVTWTNQNTMSLGNIAGSGWYYFALAINPRNTSEIIFSGLDGYKSVNNGQTFTKFTRLGTVSTYVHVDHHFVQWSWVGAESRIIIGCDGGVFLSRDGGNTWIDRNRNLAIKQFYSCSIHPTAGSNYMLGGTQDNGSHQFKNAGLSFTTEVTGGDGGFTHINQLNPQIQFTSQTGAEYYKSFNGGQSWQQAPIPAPGLFINPWDYDDAQNIMYMPNGNNQFRRWSVIPNTSFAVGGPIGFPSAFKLSPYTPNRLFIGSTQGGLVRIDNANTINSDDINNYLLNIRGASFPNTFLNCINVGTSDNFLVAVFTNYGINNVWYSNDGGSSWSAIDGNLPDMPIRWAVFVPGSDTKIILATEAGIYTTNQVSGVNTIWLPSPGFPAVRTDMLKIRPSDNTIVAATHGRGLFTAIIPVATFPVTLINFNGRLNGNSVQLTWQTATEEKNKGFAIERSSDGTQFKNIGFVNGSGSSNTLRSYTFNDKDIAQELNYYRLKQIDVDGQFEYSKTILIKYPLNGKAAFTVLNNPFRNELDMQFGAGAQGRATIRLLNVSGQTVMQWSGMIQPGNRMRLNIPHSITPGLYVVQLLVNNERYSVPVRRD